MGAINEEPIIPEIVWRVKIILSFSEVNHGQTVIILLQPRLRDGVNNQIRVKPLSIDIELRVFIIYICYQICYTVKCNSNNDFIY